MIHKCKCEDSVHVIGLYFQLIHWQILHRFPLNSQVHSVYNAFVFFCNTLYSFNDLQIMNNLSTLPLLNYIALKKNTYGNVKLSLNSRASSEIGYTCNSIISQSTRLMWKLIKFSFIRNYSVWLLCIPSKNTWYDIDNFVNNS